MEFDNDPVKAAINLKTHKVSFEEAASVFGDPLAYTFEIPTIRLAKNAGLCLAFRVWPAFLPSSLLTGAENIALSVRV